MEALIVIDRRSFLALGMAAPLTVPSLRLNLPDPRIDPLNTGGVLVLGISPDASLLVGTRERETLCILDATTREIVAESNPFPELRLLDEASMRWKPDGVHIAFSLMPWAQLRDSDIFTMNAETGDITNLTPEETTEEANSLLETSQANVDTNPLWLDNETLIFTRHPFAENTEATVELMKLNLGSGRIEPWVDLAPANVMYALSPLWLRSDGSVVFGIESRPNRTPVRGAIIVDADGSYRNVDVNGLGHISVIDVSDTHLVAHEPETFNYWYVPLDSDAEPEKLWERFALPGTFSMRSEVKLGPEPDTVMLVAENENDQLFLLQLDDSGTTEIAELYPEVQPTTVHWAGDSILVSGREDSWLIEPEG